jgi:hypothetical protein
MHFFAVLDPSGADDPSPSDVSERPTAAFLRARGAAAAP